MKESNDFQSSTKRFAEILKKVRLSIESKKYTRLVCLEIQRVATDTYDSIYLQSYIQKSLEGTKTVGSWLEKFHPEFYATQYDHIGYRLAWIDQMIEMFERGEG